MKNNKARLAFEMLKDNFEEIEKEDQYEIIGGDSPTSPNPDEWTPDSTTTNSPYPPSWGPAVNGVIQLPGVSVTPTSNNSSQFLNSIGLAMDSNSVSFSIANATNIFLNGTSIEATAFKYVTGSGTIVGAIIGGGPALVHIIDGNGSSQDWGALGLAGAGLLSEFTGVGEAYDGTVGVGIAVGNLLYDAYNY